MELAHGATVEIMAGASKRSWKIKEKEDKTRWRQQETESYRNLTSMPMERPAVLFCHFMIFIHYILHEYVSFKYSLLHRRVLFILKCKTNLISLAVVNCAQADSRTRGNPNSLLIRTIHTRTNVCKSMSF